MHSKPLPLRQMCRDCGEQFPYSPDADRCNDCAREALGNDDHSASRNIETLQREAPHLVDDTSTRRRVSVDVGDVLVIDGHRYMLDSDGDRYIVREIS